MNYRRSLLNLLLILYIPVASAKGRYEVHEWGTFTSLIGSNGYTVDGMYHEDEPLPDFVHGFGELFSTVPRPNPILNPTPVLPVDPTDPCQRPTKIPCDFIQANSITQKMETPVIYFYTNFEQEVEVDVRYPQGAVTETFPGPAYTFPTSQSAPYLQNGHTIFRVKLNSMDDRSLDHLVPQVAADNIYSHARRPNSSIVQAGAETEKFIFYRGVGNFTPEAYFSSHNGDFSISAYSGKTIPAAFLIDVAPMGQARMLELGPIPQGTSANVPADVIAHLQAHETRADDIISDRQAMRQSLINALTGAGLFEDEAIAMIDTWEHGYLQVPGLRLLYILPRTETDKILPLTITPRPYTLERVFVGRVEVMLDTYEQALVDQVLATRYYFDPAVLGRFAEPKLRRAADVYRARPIHDEEGNALFIHLIDRARLLNLQL
ncbi:MAG: hypothetical protein AB7F86_11440 [Bdellovibrionales bacterium]